MLAFYILFLQTTLMILSGEVDIERLEIFLD